MEPIFDRAGAVVGWASADVVYDSRLEPRAFVRDRAVFSYARRFLGWLDDGYFRDARGAAVAYLRSARGMPLTPPPQRAPDVPLPRPARVPPMVPLAPERPAWRPAWSAIVWESFLQLDRAA